MFGLGAWEIALILGAVLIFLGPDKVPEVARQIGKGLAFVRRTSADFARQVQYADLKEQVSKAVTDVVNDAMDDKPARPTESSGPGPNDPYAKIAAEEAAARSEGAPGDDFESPPGADDPDEGQAEDAAENGDEVHVEADAPETPALPVIKPAPGAIAYADLSDDPYADEDDEINGESEHE